MIDSADTYRDPLGRERIIVVTDRLGREDVLCDLGTRYPDFTVAKCATYMSGIVEVSQHPTRAVLAFVDPTVARLDKAVAALRLAADAGTKILLCCTPESEPRARQLLSHGADDYLLYPFNGPQLDDAIGYARVDPSQLAKSATAPAADLEELVHLDDTLAAIHDTPMALIEKLAELLRSAMRACGATMVVEGAAATAGDAVARPVLSAPLKQADRIIGQLTVGQPIDGPYTSTDVRKLEHYASIAAKILKSASLQREWSRLAVTDECSGLPNRRHLHRKLDDILSRAGDERFQVTVLLFDVDDFKQYNDRFGHAAGDEIIRLIGRLFQQHCREQDVVTRYGGDEFAVVFWEPQGSRVAGSSHLQCALDVLDRFRSALRSERPACLDAAESCQLTISAGLATYPWDGSTRNELLKRADEALLSAKRAGKNRIFFIGGHADDESTTS